MSYETIAAVYDRFSGVDAVKRADFLARIFQKKKGGIILDVGCGSGKVTAALADRGFSMIGCDQSAEMLDAARENVAGKDVLLLRQSAEKLDLYGTVAGACAAGDVINHITSEKTLLKALLRISLFMEKGGIFVFDVNTERKFEKTLSGGVFYYEDKDDSLIWRSFYNEKTRLLRNDITRFSRKDGLYSKSEETFYERYYDKETLLELAKEAGFSLLSIKGGEYKNRSPREDDDRVVFIMEKI